MSGKITVMALRMKRTNIAVRAASPRTTLTIYAFNAYPYHQDLAQAAIPSEAADLLQ